MKIASVIVDVPTLQTDRSFDYLIPDKWIHVIQPGMRVIVPFGPRKVQGFVVEVKADTTIESLKEIDSLLDVSPVLNDELLNLGFWLTKETLCLAISAFQAMLPAALKAKYDKEIRVKKEEVKHLLPEELAGLFHKRSAINWKEIENTSWLPLIQKEIQKGTLEVHYNVKDKARKKWVKMIEPALDREDLQSALDQIPSKAAKQKDIIRFFMDHYEPFPYKDVLEKTQSTASSIKALIEKGILIEKQQEIYRDPYENKNFIKTKPFPLTPEQQKAIAPILESIENEKHKVFLMYGVTGSGKTEVYMQAIDAVLKQGKEAIVLVPEISLTPQMVQRFKGRFGSKVAVLHSGLSIGEKYDEWRKIQRKEVRVVVGARSAIFAPFENLGIIIIDEEHETSYKQEENPRYHARDVAIYRGKHHGCPIVLGSATPTLESFARAKKNVYELLVLSKRMNDQPLPKVEIVDMREELRSGNRSMFSSLLFEKIKERIEKKEQTVLFLNRRGYSSFVMCRDCGYVVSCPNCDISLTYHRFDQRMKCHYCGFEEVTVTNCPECGSEHIRYFGTGTQKVEEELGKILPEARVIRMDVDTTSKKGAHEKLLAKFEDGQADILLGTQMIAKGLDFPNVTLVGVLTADTMLHLPDFRASEKTFQLLTQVSGRAGRHQLPGEVIIQTYTPDHYSVELAAKHDYLSFFQKEMMMRKLHAYPPFYYLALITVSHPEVTKAASVTEKIAAYLKNRISKESIVLGPVASPIARINDRYRYQCMVKYKREPNLATLLKQIIHHYQQDMVKESLMISIDLNPYTMM